MGLVTEILTADQLLQLSDERKLELGRLVSDALGEHRESMLQYSDVEVKQIIDEGRAIVALDRIENKLDGFAQLSPWHDGSDSVGAIEFRGWLSRKTGAGMQVLKGAVALSLEKYPDIPVYAVIEANNWRAQQIVLNAGAEEVAMPDAIKIELKAGNEPAFVKTFDLTDIN